MSTSAYTACPTTYSVCFHFPGHQIRHRDTPGPPTEGSVRDPKPAYVEHSLEQLAKRPQA
jgi:hypothetical protein